MCFEYRGSFRWLSLDDQSCYLAANGAASLQFLLDAQRLFRSNGNGIGVPAAPSVADIDGDGRLEIVLSSFDHGLDVYRVPGSAANCLPWPTGRGNLLRNGMGPATAG